MPAEKLKKTCYVIIGFGKKTDFPTGRTIDLDKTYRNIIQPAAEEAGLECFRADDISHSGVIDMPLYEWLLNADVVVADLSTASPSVLYQLGVRHALRPSTTIVMAEDQLYVLPFDVNSVVVRRYRHLGEDIGFAEVMRCRQELAVAMAAAMAGDPSPVDSPVYTYLPSLTPPGTTRIETTPAADSISERLLMADEAQRRGDFRTAKALLTIVRGAMKADEPSVIQRLALVTYKSKLPTEQEALEEARDLLQTLSPATSNDPETLGLWGAVHKRLWDATRDPQYLDEAVRGYERGFSISNDYYNGINLAFMLDVRATVGSNRAEAVADAVQAMRVRRAVIEICERELTGDRLQPSDKYWVLATLAECFSGIGEEEKAERSLEEAAAAAPARWMVDSTREQLDKLRELRSASPLNSL